MVEYENMYNSLPYQSTVRTAGWQRLPAFLGILLVMLFAMPDAQSAGKTAFLQPPTIVRNPNASAPLAALLSFKAENAAKTRVIVSDGEHDKVINFPRLAGEGAPLPILGLRAGTDFSLRVIIIDEQGGELEWPHSLSYVTAELPQDRYLMPVQQVRVSKPSKMEPGITILSVRRNLLVRPQDRSPAQQKFIANYGLLLGIDEQGDVVWYYQSDARIAGIDRLRNGNIIYHLNSFETVEIDMLGNVINRWYAERRPAGPPDDSRAIPVKGIQTLHHQPHELPNGNFLALSANSRLIKNWYTSEYDSEPRADQQVMGDTIIEFNREGDILWEWNAFDYLDVFQIGYEAFFPYWTTRGFPKTRDWTHGNGVNYDEEDDSVVVSFKLLDAIIKIDRKSKEIVWIFGDHANWGERFQDKLLTPVGEEFRWPFHQHNPRWTDNRTLLVFNNNRSRAKPFDGRDQVAFEDTHSYSIEYSIDEEARTVKQLWVSEPVMREDSCNSFAMSEARRLPVTGNILEINGFCAPAGKENVTYDAWNRAKRHVQELPRGGRVREYTHENPAEVVFEASFADPDSVLAWEVFGGFRVPNLYSPISTGSHTE